MIHILPSGKRYCSFCKSTSCSHLPLSFPMENDNSKNTHIQDFTSDSQAITSNSQPVHILKRKYQRKVKDSIFERFHNFGVKFNAIINWDALFKYDEVRLNNNVCYKRLNFEHTFVRVFKKSILITIRSTSDIKHLSVKEAELRAQSLINDTLKLLPKSINVQRKKEITSTHNSFVNGFIAKNCKDPVKVVIEGETRFLTDNSHNSPEDEFVNKEHAIPDSQVWENEVEATIGRGLTKDFLAQSIHTLIQDREYYAENLKSHVIAIRELAFMLKRLNRRNMK
jgi:hypothetical protein